MVARVEYFRGEVWFDNGPDYPVPDTYIHVPVVGKYSVMEYVEKAIELQIMRMGGVHAQWMYRLKGVRYDWIETPTMRQTVLWSREHGCLVENIIKPVDRALWKKIGYKA